MCVCVYALGVCPFIWLLFTPWFRQSVNESKRNETNRTERNGTGRELTIRLQLWEKGTHFRTHKESVGDARLFRTTNPKAFFVLHIFSVCVLTVQIQKSCSCLTMCLHFDGNFFLALGNIRFRLLADISYISTDEVSVFEWEHFDSDRKHHQKFSGRGDNSNNTPSKVRALCKVYGWKMAHKSKCGCKTEEVRTIWGSFPYLIIWNGVRSESSAISVLDIEHTLTKKSIWTTRNANCDMRMHNILFMTIKCL